jgi:hypothetical protein
MEVIDELLITARRLYLQIVGLKNTTPIAFFVDQDNLSAFLSRRVPVTASQARNLLTSYSKDQKPTVDFEGFYYLIQNLLERHFPCISEIDVLYMLRSELLTGEQDLVDELVLNCLYSSENNLQVDDVLLATLVKNLCLPTALDLLYTNDEILESFKLEMSPNSERLQNIYQEFLTLQKIENIEVFGAELETLKNAFSFMCNSKTPVKFAKIEMLTPYIFNKFVESNMLQTLVSFFRHINSSQQELGPKHQYASTQNEILSILMVFFHLFKYKNNFAIYNQIMANFNFSVDFLKNLIIDFIIYTSNDVVANYTEQNYTSLLCLLATLE